MPQPQAAYPHFAVPGLYLENGYTVTGSPADPERMYEDENQLEHCVRRLLLRKPERLRGWDLRFLRAGLSLAQQDFAAVLGLSVETISEWELSHAHVPAYADLAIRVLFAARFEPALPLVELLTYANSSGCPLPAEIHLRHAPGRWEAWLPGDPVPLVH